MLPSELNTPGALALVVALTFALPQLLSAQDVEAEVTGALRSSGKLPVGGIDYDALDDPRKDGWETEDFNNRAGSQLEILGKLLEHPNEINAGSLAELVSAEFYRRMLTRFH